MSEPTAFEIESWEKDAKRLIICTGCYGSGEDRWNQGKACPTCQGEGRAPAEPHVLRLIQEITRLRRHLGEIP